MGNDCDSTVENHEEMAKLKYDYDPERHAIVNRSRPTIQYGLFPKASTKIKGVSE